MTLYIDGDSCLREARELVVRAANRENVPVLCFANRKIPFEKGLKVKMVVVESKEDAADRAILDQVIPGDLVLTKDIPLAAALVEAKVAVINDRGTSYTKENVREKLSFRNFTFELQKAGLKPEPTAQYAKKDWDAFVQMFDKTFMSLVRSQKTAPNTRK